MCEYNPPYNPYPYNPYNPYNPWTLPMTPTPYNPDCPPNYPWLPSKWTPTSPPVNPGQVTLPNTVVVNPLVSREEFEAFRSDLFEVKALLSQITNNIELLVKAYSDKYQEKLD